ncbi:hypothetical protein N3930_18290, partial [Bacillus thuringiensis]|nr:hypothetical protein [Bacillus thuringiensis]
FSYALLHKISTFFAALHSCITFLGSFFFIAKSINSKVNIFNYQLAYPLYEPKRLYYRPLYFLLFYLPITLCGASPTPQPISNLKSEGIPLKPNP